MSVNLTVDADEDGGAPGWAAAVIEKQIVRNYSPSTASLAADPAS